MKRILFGITILFCMCCMMHAQEYQLTEIEDVAISFLNRKSLNSSARSNTAATKQISSVEAIIRNNSDYMYIVNAEDSAGWVVISNEKSYPTIIAHADSGSFVYDTEILPPALLCILEQHMDAIDSTRANAFDNVQSISNSTSIKSYNVEEYTSPILLKQNRWKQSNNQGAYDENQEYDCDRVYNKFVPSSHDISCGRALVGCGAVAMAQIMSYWQWPDYAFIRDTIIIGVCSGDWNQRFYDWDNMPNTITSTTTIYQADAIAGLLRDCAYAANTIFHGPNIFCEDGCSSAIIGHINTALKNDFGYHTNRVHEYSSTEMGPILCQEIDAKRPVLCQAWENSDTTTLSGHTFIIDGYKTFYEGEKLVTEFAINWGAGNSRNNPSYYSLDFNGYDGNRTFLTEIYPRCELREDDIFLSEEDYIMEDDNRTYYSTNNVTLSSNNNSIVVDNGGHLLVKAGNEVRLKPGFHAKAGSNIHIMINDTMCSSPQTSSAPQRMAARSSSATTDDTEATNDTPTNNTLEDMENNMIQSTTIYTISGQLIQTILGGQHDAVHLPNGMYVLQHRMSDGSVRSEKLANYGSYK